MLNILLVLVIAGLLIYALKRAGVGDTSAAENREEGAGFLAKNEEVTGVVTLESGVQIQFMEPKQEGVHPTVSDRVTVHYEGRLINGDVFDSSIQRGEPIAFGLNQVIAGWTEGLQHMAVGDKARLFIPSEHGYGNRKAGSIPAGSVLIFEVELLGIND